MEAIEIFSVYKIDGLIKRWRKEFPSLSIRRIETPTSDCYILFKYGSVKNIRYPFEAIYGAQKGFIEGWIKECDSKKILQPEELEAELRKIAESNIK
jgi:hypothetical protein